MSSHPTLSLDGKVALVTGGSRGIGAATVRLFVRAGARVVFNYVRAQAEAQRLVEECGADRCHAVQADLTGTASAATLVNAAVARFGSLDALVVNHGIWVSEDVEIDQMTDEQWRTTIAVNLDSAFAVVKHAVAQMKRQARGGHVVMVSSTAGQRGEASPNVSQGGRRAAKSSSICQRSEFNIWKSSYGPSPAGLLAVLSSNVSIFGQGKTDHSLNRLAYPSSSRYPLPFSSAELQLATAGTPGGTARGKDSPSTATPRSCVR